ncbi:MAG TPA: hypothetical protein VFF54_05050 [Thermodesulfobacteriota bacterium]|nr:hypothetical protein [Thermodesulfobacteriota bacterium]
MTTWAVWWRGLTVSAAISWFLKLLMVGLLPYLVYTGNYLFTIVTLLAVALSLAPSIIERNYRIQLPFELDLLITLSIFLHTFLGEWLMFYERVWMWDKFLHFFNSAVVAILAFVAVYSLHYTKKLRLTVPFVGFFTLIFSGAMGAVWEIIEFWVDIIFYQTMQTGLNDTMWDLMYDLIGGGIIAVLGMIYVKYAAPETRRRLTRELGEVFGAYKRNREKRPDRTNKGINKNAGG